LEDGCGVGIGGDGGGIGFVGLLVLEEVVLDDEV